MQGETCKGTVMSRNVLNLSKKKYSILDKRLFDNNVLYFLTGTIENFIIGLHVFYIQMHPMFRINFLTIK